MDVEELRRSQRRCRKNQRPEKLTELPLISVSASVSGSQDSEDDDEDASTPSAETGERNLLSMLSISTESLDFVGKREKFLKNTFESLSGTEVDADRNNDTAARNVAVINATKQTRSDNETSSKREELQRRIEETRRKLQSVGYRSNLKTSQSISDLSRIPEKDFRNHHGVNLAHRYTPSGEDDNMFDNFSSDSLEEPTEFIAKTPRRCTSDYQLSSYDLETSEYEWRSASMQKVSNQESFYSNYDKNTYLSKSKEPTKNTKNLPSTVKEASNSSLPYQHDIFKGGNLIINNAAKHECKLSKSVKLLCKSFENALEDYEPSDDCIADLEEDCFPVLGGSSSSTPATSSSAANSPKRLWPPASRAPVQRHLPKRMSSSRQPVLPNKKCSSVAGSDDCVEGSSGSLRRACSLSDLANPTPRRILHDTLAQG
ncbi:unnamed protein product, partial [Timema podura]|nr:unnamed protein product [Timema podura]